MKPQVTIDNLGKLDLRVGEVVEASEVEGSAKLLKLIVSFGDFEKIIYSGIRKWYSSESLTGRKFIFIVNLAPRTFKIGANEFTSEGMILAAGEDEAVLYQFDKDLTPGTNVH